MANTDGSCPSPPARPDVSTPRTSFALLPKAPERFGIDVEALTAPSSSLFTFWSSRFSGLRAPFCSVIDEFLSTASSNHSRAPGDRHFCRPTDTYKGRREQKRAHEKRRWHGCLELSRALLGNTPPQLSNSEALQWI